MKRCPSCGNTYTDDSLRFCLSDGKPLEFDDGDKFKVEIPTVEAKIPTTISYEQKENPTEKNYLLFLIPAAVLGLFLIGGLAAALYFFSQTGRQTQNSETDKNSNKFAINSKETYSSPTPDKIKSKATDTPKPTIDSSGQQTRKVNSPNDGFLALRSEPDSESGDRMDKIPHGTNVEIVECQNESKTIAGRKGKWCYVAYADKRGWVFDAWLIK